MYKECKTDKTETLTRFVFREYCTINNLSLYHPYL